MILAIMSCPRMKVRAIIAALPYVIKREMEGEIWRTYIAVCAQFLTENTAKAVGGKHLNISYYDLLKAKPKDTRSAEDIVADVIRNAGLKVIE